LKIARCPFVKSLALLRVARSRSTSRSAMLDLLVELNDSRPLADGWRRQSAQLKHTTCTHTHSHTVQGPCVPGTAQCCSKKIGRYTWTQSVLELECLWRVCSPEPDCVSVSITGRHFKKKKKWKIQSCSIKCHGQYEQLNVEVNLVKYGTVP